MKQKLLLFLLTIGCACASHIPGNVVTAKNNFESTQVLKTKVGQTDPNDSQARNGLLVYGYDNGASLQFGSTVEGVFKTSLKSIINNFGSKDLKEFSIVFTETTTEDQFAIKVLTYDSYSYVAINYQGQLGGVNYFESPYSVGKSYGFSGIANNEMHFTYLEGTSDIDLLFNPNEMVVQTKLKDNAYHNVWDFKKENNDGRIIKNNMQPFNEYNVSIVFDSIAANGCGNLIIYNFAGFDLSNSDLNSDKPIIATNIVANAIVGGTYTLPTPRVTSPKLGQLDSSDVEITLFNQHGDVVNLINNSFTPNESGNYYLYYKYNKGEASSYTYACVKALTKDEVNISFSDVYLPSSEGQGKVITIPGVQLETNLGVKTNRFDCYVTVLLDDQPLSNYTKVKTGCSFAFSKTGIYSFVYGCSSFETTLTKKVVIDGRLTVNEDSDVSYSVGEEFVLPKVEFIKYGRTVQTLTTVYDPFGKEIKDVPFKITQEGIYTISYLLASELEPITKKVVVKETYASRFDDENAVNDNMVSNNSINGVKLSLQNNKTVTYNKVINLNDFSFNPNLQDQSENREIVHLYIQPSTQGKADLEALYVKLTDANDPNNFLTIRARYIEQGNFRSGCVLRAKANNQTTYVGYYYHFYTTEMQVDNATSHEEGGFTSYFNFTHIVDNVDSKDVGLPLYFDNKSGKVYSRPAWLTGHNYNPGEPYDNMQVPWLIYDFKTDDREKSGGNIPWKGFSDGNVIMSFYGKGISSTANVFVTTIGGEELDEKCFTDDVAPEINVDENVLVENKISGEYEAPGAIVGKEYDVFPYETKDALSSVKDVKISVVDPDCNESEVTNGSFIPTKVGTYKLRYTASDVFDNRAVKEISINASDGLAPLTLKLDGTIPQEASYGDIIKLPKANYSGGSGNINLVTEAVTETGEKVPVSNNQISATIPGSTYTVTYKITDYLKQTKSISFDISVKVTDEIIFDESSIVLPSGFIHKDIYTFGSYIGVTYNKNYEPTFVPATIKVSDANGTKTIAKDLKYSPTLSDDVNVAKIAFVFSHGSVENTYSYNVPIVKASTGVNYISSFFTSTNAVVTPDKSDITFASDGSSTMSFEFLRGVYSEQLLLLIGLNVDKINAEGFSITLRDMYNSDEVVKFNYLYKYDPISQSNKLYCSLNNNNEYVVYNIGSSHTLGVDYSNQTHVLSDFTGANVFTIDKYLNGYEFKGFSSNNVYFTFEAHGINNGDFEVHMQKINNQSTNAIRDDYDKPTILLDGVIANRVARGTEIVIPKASSNDVLNAITSLTVTVTGPNGEIVVSSYTPDNELKFIVSECGTYIVTYVSTDAKGNKTVKEFYISSYDEVIPELQFKSSVPTQAKVGDTIKLPGYTIIDNDPDTCKVEVFVYRPDGTNSVVNNNRFNCTVKGEYVVTYLVTDINDNINHYYFVINVK